MPAIAPADSPEELLLDPTQLAAIRNIRRHLITLPPVQGVKSLTDAMTKMKTNAELVGAIRV